LVRQVQQQLLRDGAYLPRIANTDPDDLARLPGVTVSATSEAPMTIQTGADHIDPIWEYAGISTAESAALAYEVQQHPAGRSAELNAPHAQAVVISSGQIDTITLPLANHAEAARTVRLHLRQAIHLRDFGPAEPDGQTLAMLEATLAPGQSSVTFRPERPVVCQPGAPVVLALDALPDVTWDLSWQEPPGTQAARWDEELGYWRWIHGTLGFSLAPVSTPYGAENVLSGVTRPEARANLWVSDPHQPLPQSLELHWPTPVEIGQVELTFDSQLSGWIWEGAFPLIPKTFEIALCDNGTDTWQTVATVDGNVQRRVVTGFAITRTDALRITIRATQGGRTARIVEVRAYASSRI
jgi:hypothetical protein